MDSSPPPLWEILWGGSLSPCFQRTLWCVLLPYCMFTHYFYCVLHAFSCKTKSQFQHSCSLKKKNTQTELRTTNRRQVQVLVQLKKIKSSTKIPTHTAKETPLEWSKATITTGNASKWLHQSDWFTREVVKFPYYCSPRMLQIWTLPTPNWALCRQQRKWLTIVTHLESVCE